MDCIYYSIYKHKNDVMDLNKEIEPTRTQMKTSSMWRQTHMQGSVKFYVWVPLP